MRPDLVTCGGGGGGGGRGGLRERRRGRGSGAEGGRAARMVAWRRREGHCGAEGGCGAEGPGCGAERAVVTALLRPLTAEGGGDGGGGRRQR